MIRSPLLSRLRVSRHSQSSNLPKPQPKTMPYDPTYPPEGGEINSAPLRDQFAGLKDLIDSVPVLNAAQIDSVTPLPPGALPAASVSVIGNTLHFTFDLPQAIDSAVVDAVSTVPPADPAAVSVSLTGTTLHFSFSIPRGLDGTPGEVTNATLSVEIAGTARNPSSVAPLNLTVSDPPTQAEMQAIANKLDEFLAAAVR